MLWIAASALAVPPVDDAVRTGARAPGDSAVVIGIEDYAWLPDVPYAARDAEAFYRFLIYTRGVPTDRVRLLDRSASREQMLKALSEAGGRTSAGGRVWVYFSGHGAASPETGERVLLGADVQSDLDTFVARSVSVGEVEKAATAGGGEALLVLDTCYSGRGRNGGDLVGGKRFAVPSWAGNAPQAKITEWSAAGPDQWSSPYEPAQHGAFTYLVLGALRGWADGQIDGRRDGNVTLEEAHHYVRDGLKSLGVTDQQPVLNGQLGWQLSNAKEKPPELTAVVRPVPAPAPVAVAPVAVAPAPAPAPVPAPAAPPAAPGEPGQLQITVLGVVNILVDGVLRQPLALGAPLLVDDLAPGPHRVEVLNALNKPVLVQQVTVSPGEQLRLQYRKKTMVEIGRGPRVEVPLAPAAPIGVAAANASSAEADLMALIASMGSGDDEALDTGSAPAFGAAGLDAMTMGAVLMQLQMAGLPDYQILMVQELANNGAPLTSAQVGQILSLFGTPQHRVTAAQILAGNVVDPQNVAQMLGACASDAERQQIRAIIASAR